MMSRGRGGKVDGKVVMRLSLCIYGIPYVPGARVIVLAPEQPYLISVSPYVPEPF